MNVERLADKTPQQWLEEIQRLGQDINTRATLIGEKRAQKRELSLAAVQGDEKAAKRVKALAAEIDKLIWAQGLCDDALLCANQHLQQAEQTAHDAKVAALLAERDRVTAEADTVRARLVPLVNDLVAVLNQTESLARRQHELSIEAGQSEAANSWQRRTRRYVANYMATRLHGTYLHQEWDYIPWPAPTLRRETLQVFDAVALVENEEELA